ncbi:MAG: Asp-tRNA(Asn)/Glu-tRNA(Gln) amidotransferase subunit GatC [Bacillota bacterium]
MMTIDFGKEVDYVARLARLRLSDAEKGRMAGQLSDILETARRVQELNTENVAPTSHVISLPTAFREDVVEASLPLNRVLQNAPAREKDFFRVPRIADGEQDE